MAEILIGTSGFSYPDWVGPVYAEGTPAGEFLRLYSREFPMVELNFSYYRQPEPRVLAKMAESTPAGFLFAVKAHQSLTHEIPADLAAAAATFRQGLLPLEESSRLAAVLLQFPYSFHYTPPSRKHLEEVCALLEGLPLAVEFRNAEWQRDSVYEGLARRGAAIVNVDEPLLRGLPRPTERVTSELGYVRLHGRNNAQWWKGDSASRYDYLYTREELSGWLPGLRAMQPKVKLLLVAFNNHRRGQAVQNARELKQLLLLDSPS